MRRADRIKAKLLALRALDRKGETFGSAEPWGGHHFEMAPVLSPRQLAYFERKHAIELPAEYREFLTEVEGGGAGPAYGLLPLRSCVDQTLRRKPRRVSRAFEHDTRRANQLVAARMKQAARGVPEWERTTAELPRNGYVFLADHGCGEYSILVTSGEQRGRVWYLYESATHPQYGVRDGAAHIFGFYDWYEDWLDRNPPVDGPEAGPA